MPRSKKSGGYSGRQTGIRGLVIKPRLQTIENIYAGTDYEVVLTTAELTTICPRTGLPDFCDLTIRYVPGRLLVEEKSLKLYLTGYRSVGIFQENATNKIFEDFLSAVRPGRLRISAVWNRRGGIGVTVEREYPKNR